MHGALIASVLIASLAPGSAGELEPGPFTCDDVVEVSFSAALDGTQWLSLGWGELPFQHGYGEYDRNTWRDLGRTNDARAPLAIMPPDNLRTEKSWPAGTLSIRCLDGRSADVDLPAFTDVPGVGFVDRAGRRFAGGFWVGADGTAYFDAELTRPATRTYVTRAGLVASP
jgi:hypothetical protein